MLAAVTGNDTDKAIAEPGADRAILEALWAKVVDDVGASKAHDAFIKHCQQSDQLPEAARRYREHRDALDGEAEETKELINKRLAAIATLAMAQIDAQRSDPSKSRALRILQVVIAILTFAAIVGVARMLLQ